MKRIYFIRHGQSLGNVWKDAYEDDDMNFLSPKGEIEAKAAGLQLRDHKVSIDDWYCSQLLRARQTTHLIATEMQDRYRKYHLIENLNENHYWGSHDHDQTHQIQRTKVGEFMESTVVEFLNNDEKTAIGIVSHHFTMGFLFEWMGPKFGIASRNIDGEGKVFPNAAVFVWDFNNSERIQLLSRIAEDY